ncbi:hypothetical protein M0802_001114 [Mischocyttarus mexicanus]|nr:hypothetical protein M0802_001114 [Mischocyttarus mexicanus]
MSYVRIITRRNYDIGDGDDDDDDDDVDYDDDDGYDNDNNNNANGTGNDIARYVPQATCETSGIFHITIGLVPVTGLATDFHFAPRTRQLAVKPTTPFPQLSLYPSWLRYVLQCLYEVRNSNLWDHLGNPFGICLSSAASIDPKRRGNTCKPVSELTALRQTSKGRLRRRWASSREDEEEEEEEEDEEEGRTVSGSNVKRLGEASSPLLERSRDSRRPKTDLTSRFSTLLYDSSYTRVIGQKEEALSRLHGARILPRHNSTEYKIKSPKLVSTNDVFRNVDEKKNDKNVGSNLL